MSVLKGEGKVPILFGTSSIAAGSRTHEGYLARPDLAGEWPTVLVVPDVFGVSSSVKDLCRRIARQGFAAIGVDPYEKKPPGRSLAHDEITASYHRLDTDRVLRMILDVVRFLRNPAGFWSSAEHGYGVLALGEGLRFVLPLLTAAQPEVLGLAYTAQTDESNARLARFGGPILGVWGGDDEVVDLTGARRLREEHRRTEIVMYGGVGHAFLDDGSDDYDFAAAQDALDRLAEFFAKELPPPPA